MTQALDIGGHTGIHVLLNVALQALAEVLEHRGALESVSDCKCKCVIGSDVCGKEG